MAKNADLNKANRNKKDEFYTQLTDIEKEMRYYVEHFKDKVVFCNCDDPDTSNFWRFFDLNFERLGLKRLIATHYEASIPSFKLELFIDESTGERKIVKTRLSQNGDFRSPECIDLLLQSDIIVTNPPFSLFREYIAQLFKYEKKFIIIGNMNAIHYKEVFPYIKNNKLWIGASIHSGDRMFNVPDDYPLNASGCGIDEDGRKYIRVKGVRWFTNVDLVQRHEKIILYRNYSPDVYPSYINFDAIDVNSVSEIPCDYDGNMGVPDNFIDVYNPEQFDIIGLADSDLGVSIGFSANLTRDQLKALKEENPSFRRGNPIFRDKNGQLKKPYSRIIIKRRKDETL